MAEQLTHFERLGLPRRFASTRPSSSGTTSPRSREPSIPTSPATTRPASKRSAALNEAYATLRDPVPAGGVSVERWRAARRRRKCRRCRRSFWRRCSNCGCRSRRRNSDPDGRTAEFERLADGRRRACWTKPAAVGLGRTPAEQAAWRIRQTLNASKFVNGLLRDLRED